MSSRSVPVYAFTVAPISRRARPKKHFNFEGNSYCVSPAPNRDVDSLKALVNTSGVIVPF